MTDSGTDIYDPRNSNDGTTWPQFLFYAPPDNQVLLIPKPEKKIPFTPDDQFKEMKKKLEWGKTQKSYKRIGRPGKSFSSRQKKVLGVLERKAWRDQRHVHVPPKQPRQRRYGSDQRPKGVPVVKMGIKRRR